MNREELSQSLFEANKKKMLISKHKLMKIMGIGQSRADKILSDLAPMYNQRISRVKGTKLYFVDDIAREIIRKGL